MTYEGIPQHVLDAWSNCPTPDCENKVCIWAGTGLCHPCSVRVVGREEMKRRYVETDPGKTS